MPVIDLFLVVHQLPRPLHSPDAEEKQCQTEGEAEQEVSGVGSQWTEVDPDISRDREIDDNKGTKPKNVATWRVARLAALSSTSASRGMWGSRPGSGIGYRSSSTVATSVPGRWPVTSLIWLSPPWRQSTRQNRSSRPDRWSSPRTPRSLVPGRQAPDRHPWVARAGR